MNYHTIFFRARVYLKMNYRTGFSNTLVSPQPLQSILSSWDLELTPPDDLYGQVTYHTFIVERKRCSGNEMIPLAVLNEVRSSMPHAT